MEAERGIAYFESLQLLEGRKFSSLDSAVVLMTALGEPQNQIPSIHVAGTNGKGSVCALLAAMLYSQGFTVGQTCSPHLSSVTERCLINGCPVDAESFGHTIDHIMAVAARLDLAPSYFVLGLLASFLEFNARKLDWMVVETGLGGRLDATNTMSSPKFSVITGISADHMEILGPTLSDIAAEKAGIARAGVPMFVGVVVKEARDAIAKIANETGAAIQFMGEDFHYDEARDELQYQNMRRPAFLRELSLEGDHQKRNAILAVRVAYELGLSEAAIARGLARVRWPGRLELIQAESGTILFDVGHNPEGTDVLCRYLENLEYERIVFVVSVLSRKDWRAMLERTKLTPRQKSLVFWILTDSGYPDAVRPEELYSVVGEGEVISKPEAALTRAMDIAGADGLVVVTGSVFLVGALRAVITQSPICTIAP